MDRLAGHRPHTGRGSRLRIAGVVIFVFLAIVVACCDSRLFSTLIGRSSIVLVNRSGEDVHAVAILLRLPDGTRATETIPLLADGERQVIRKLVSELIVTSVTFEHLAETHEYREGGIACRGEVLHVIIEPGGIVRTEYAQSDEISGREADRRVERAGLGGMQAMIDPATGAVAFERPVVVVVPDLTREAFRATAWGAAAADWVINEPWHSWKLAEPHLSAGIRMLVVLFFHGERLSMVELCNADPAFGTSWEDHSREREDARDASHQRWLAACVGKARIFPWGRIWAGYDERGGFSAISIRYAEPA